MLHLLQYIYHQCNENREQGMGWGMRGWGSEETLLTIPPSINLPPVKAYASVTKDNHQPEPKCWSPVRGRYNSLSGWPVICALQEKQLDAPMGHCCSWACIWQETVCFLWLQLGRLPGSILFGLSPRQWLPFSKTEETFPTLRLSKRAESCTPMMSDPFQL